MNPSAVFVYGTLLPGEHRWPLLEEYALEVRAAEVRGLLFDTGRGYPCALFDRPEGMVPGVVVDVEPARLDDALAMLDEVEGVAFGLFERVVVTTVDRQVAWS